MLRSCSRLRMTLRFSTGNKSMEIQKHAVKNGASQACRNVSPTRSSLCGWKCPIPSSLSCVLNCLFACQNGLARRQLSWGVCPQMPSCSCAGDTPKWEFDFDLVEELYALPAKLPSTCISSRLGWMSPNWLLRMKQERVLSHAAPWAFSRMSENLPKRLIACS